MEAISTSREEHQYVPDALSRLCMNNNPPPPTADNSMLMVLQSAVHLDNQTYELIKKVHSKQIGHWGLKICKKLLRDKGHGSISNRDIREFIRQCPTC